LTTVPRRGREDRLTDPAGRLDLAMPLAEESRRRICCVVMELGPDICFSVSLLLQISRKIRWKRRRSPWLPLAGSLVHLLGLDCEAGHLFSFLFFSFLPIHKTVTLIWPKRAATAFLSRSPLPKACLRGFDFFFSSFSFLQGISQGETAFLNTNLKPPLIATVSSCTPTAMYEDDVVVSLYLEVEDKTSESDTAAPRARHVPSPGECNRRHSLGP
jgi:hypothetical protein